MGQTASQITSLTIVYSTVNSGTDQRKHQSSASLGFVRGIHRGPVNSPHTWPVTRKMFPFDDVIMIMQKVFVCHDIIVGQYNVCWWWTEFLSLYRSLRFSRTWKSGRTPGADPRGSQTLRPSSAHRQPTHLRQDALETYRPAKYKCQR